ncbi:MAG: hypothetical protein J5495_00290 [Bacteroidales bacterium]|nr:hypothetical protein [Bacteroidales bacterium]
MNKMKNSAFLALALTVALMATAPLASAQGGRRTTTQQQQQQEQVTTETRNTNATTSTPATNSGSTSTQTRRQTTTSQPAQTTTNTRQTTPQVNTQPSQTTTKPSGSTGTTSTTNRRQDATNSQKPSNQPGNNPQKPSGQNPQKPSGNQNNPPAGQNHPTSVRPGGSSTHQNGNGNAVRPSNQPQPKPQNGKNITPGYKPDALTTRPPKHPDYYKPNKPYKPKPYYSVGYHMFGVRTNTLPVGHVRRTYKNTTYYYHNGVFYKSNNLSGYIICRPPIGFAFNAYNSIPPMLMVITDPYRDDAVKISEAVALSRLYARMYPGYRMLDESVYINNVVMQRVNRYYEMDGVFYSVIGNTFTVVDPVIGALTDRLPYDYEEIWLGGDLFYLVDNIVYGVVAPEGVPYFEIFTIL